MHFSACPCGGHTPTRLRFPLPPHASPTPPTSPLSTSLSLSVRLTQKMFPDLIGQRSQCQQRLQSPQNVQSRILGLITGTGVGQG